MSVYNSYHKTKSNPSNYSYEEIKPLTELALDGEMISKNHGLNVAKIAQQMASLLDCTEVFKVAISKACYYHDVGKNCIPLIILNKPDIINYQERNVVKEHPVLGYMLCKESLDYYSDNFSIYDQELIKTVMLTHHERYDGKGYPFGLKGEEIPFGAKLCAYGDVFDALTSGRCYKNISSVFDALAIIQEQSPGQFDLSLMPIFLEAIAIIYPKEMLNDELLLNVILPNTVIVDALIPNLVIPVI